MPFKRNIKSLLVTSEVTFVPGNYSALVQGLSDCPQIGGLVILKNRTISLLGRALGLIFFGAPHFGRQLLVNYFKGSKEHEKIYKMQGKPVWKINAVNSEIFQQILIQNNFDLVINARTREIYKNAILETPPLGCINIHHGLLPDQRGIMCDLWALADHSAAGFTVHRMNKKIDDGTILEKMVVSNGTERDFLHYVEVASQLECKTMKRLLANIELVGLPDGEPNIPSKQIVMRKTPLISDLRSFKEKGLRL